MMLSLRSNDVVPAAQMKKSKSYDLDFLAHPFKIDPYKATVQKQSMVFAERVDLTLAMMDVAPRRYLPG